MTSQETIEFLKQHNELRIINETLDIKLEIPHIAYIEVKKEGGGKALLFNNPIDGNKTFNTPVLMNIFGSYKRVELLMGQHPDFIGSEIEALLHIKPPNGFMNKLGMLGDLFSLKNIFPKQIKGKGSCQEIIMQGSEVKLSSLPILTTWSEDAGPFITMGQVYTQSLDGKMVNLGMYRLQIYSDNRLGLHWQIHKDSSAFFNQYKEAGQKMPVSIAIGGDPLYTWCATAPLPYGVNELLMYGFIKKQPAKIVKSISNNLYIPEDADFVIEGWADPQESAIEGPFGDHTGYYTLDEPYPVLTVTAITQKKDPIYYATVVGKPPLEDKYMGWATSRIFLPLLKTTAPDLIDYYMPENGVFHNLILASIKPHYKGHASQIMHAFWGVGQMSFVKHAIFVDQNAPKLNDYENLTKYILDRLDHKKILISSGIIDALDHSSPEELIGGKLGIDATGEKLNSSKIDIEDKNLLSLMQKEIKNIINIKLYFKNTANPIVIIEIDKKVNLKTLFEKIDIFSKYAGVFILVDTAINDINNLYMLVWRIANNIDANRDIYINKSIVVDASNKNSLDNFNRRWPNDVNCDKKVLDELTKRDIINIDKNFKNKFYL